MKKEKSEHQKLTDVASRIELWALDRNGNIQDKHVLFDKEKEMKIPKHYDNTNGTLYKVAQERGWNAYLFDIVKRLERAEKKGCFDEDLDKSIVVIELWKNERNDTRN